MDGSTLVAADRRFKRRIELGRELEAVDQRARRGKRAALDHRRSLEANGLVGADERFRLRLRGMPNANSSHNSYWLWGPGGVRVEFHDRPAELLGFHAIDAAGIYTHHSTQVHVHLRALLGGAMGHVDALTLAPSVVLEIGRQ